MSKFLLNLLVQIFKVMPNSRIQIKIRKGFYLIQAHQVSSVKPHSQAQEAFRPEGPASLLLPPVKQDRATTPVRRRRTLPSRPLRRPPSSSMAGAPTTRLPPPNHLPSPLPPFSFNAEMASIDAATTNPRQMPPFPP
jgi:hypothetical protein